jgi:excinuclease ABC subunit A
MTGTMELIVQGATCNNLRAVDISFPHGELVVFTGVSGSGKSSLLFNTIVSEAQRRFMSGLTHSLRKNVGSVHAAKVDHISGLLPALAIRNRYQTSSRGTEDALDDIESSLSVLFSRFAQVSCVACSSTVTRTRLADALEFFRRQQGRRVLITAPLITERSEIDSKLEELQTLGYQRFQINGIEFTLDEEVPTPENIESFHVVVDRLKSREEQGTRFEESFKMARELGCGVVELQVLDGEKRKGTRFTDGRSCPECLSLAGILSPALLLGRDPAGHCLQCCGKGGAECSSTGLKQWLRLAVLQEVSYQECLQFSLTQLDAWLASFPSQQRSRISVLVTDLRTTIAPLLRLDAGYLTVLDRRHPLSDGERQKLNFSRALGLDMGELLLAFDEPLSGLHPSEREPVRQMLIELRNKGCTVCVVEHDLGLIQVADRIIELGKGAGKEGGEIVFNGFPADLETADTHTARALAGRESVEESVPGEASAKTFSINCSELFRGDTGEITLPLNSLVGICGVSGAGKSRLLTAIREMAVQSIEGPSTKTGGLTFELVRSFDQTPIGKNIRSCPATYTGAFDEIRDLFAALPAARVAGFDAATFSFNTAEGRCGECSGAGVVQTTSILLEEEAFDCPICDGKRFDPQVLRVLYKGVSIADILTMTVSEAQDIFNSIPGVAARLHALERVGLGYVPLGQPTYTLSGGEAQRLKLADALYSGVHGQKALYILDQPTRGLHQSDIVKLTDVLVELCEQGHSLIVVESEPTFLKRCGWLIELGRFPEGDRQIVNSGTISQLRSAPNSLIGQYLV